MVKASPAPGSDRLSFAERALLVAAIAAALLVVLYLSQVLILVFGAIIVSIVLRALARRLERGLKLSPRWAVVAATLFVVTLLTVILWSVGDALAAQLVTLREQLPQAWSAATSWLERTGLGRQLLEVLRGAWDSGISGEQLARAARSTLGGLGAALLMFVLGVYLAAEPRLYLRGAVRLLPPDYRPRVQAALEAAGDGVGRWLLGQGVSMLFLGTATALGLALLGVPLAAALGVITGLFAFVPFLGALASGVLSVLLAFTEGPQTALYVALLFIAIQQIEENVLHPLVHRWTVKLPPVLGLVAAVIFGILFGPLGVMFATPLMVVVMILVQRLYIDGLLEPTEIKEATP